MKKLSYYAAALLMAGSLLFSCSESTEMVSDAEISQETVTKLQQLGFSTDNLMRFEAGYLVEGDIYLTDADIDRMKPAERLAVEEQYSTNNLVSAPRVITVFMDGGKRGFSSGMQAGLDEAINRYNSENLEITFQRANSKSADITFSRLSSRDEQRGVLGSAGFPSANGDPYGTIKMSGILESTYGLSTGGIATIIAHEMGHCIGFRHTDYFDRSISCGGSPYNEGDGGVGANHIPGTPTGADNRSWMLSCTDGSSRPFTSADKTALDYLY